jgi:hypothetical protein
MVISRKRNWKAAGDYGINARRLVDGMCVWDKLFFGIELTYVEEPATPS